jgi:acetyl esterase
VAMSAEYRVIGKHKTTPFECVQDGKSAVRWIRQHAAELGVDPDRIVAAGGSAGGHVAACIGVIQGHEEEGGNTNISAMPNAMIIATQMFVFSVSSGQRPSVLKLRIPFGPLNWIF